MDDGRPRVAARREEERRNSERERAPSLALLLALLTTNSSVLWASVSSVRQKALQISPAGTDTWCASAPSRRATAATPRGLRPVTRPRVCASCEGSEGSERARERERERESEGTDGRGDVSRDRLGAAKSPHRKHTQRGSQPPLPSSVPGSGPSPSPAAWGHPQHPCPRFEAGGPSLRRARGSRSPLAAKRGANRNGERERTKEREEGRGRSRGPRREERRGEEGIEACSSFSGINLGALTMANASGPGGGGSFKSKAEVSCFSTRESWAHDTCGEGGAVEGGGRGIYIYMGCSRGSIHTLLSSQAEKKPPRPARARREGCLAAPPPPRDCGTYSSLPSFPPSLLPSFVTSTAAPISTKVTGRPFSRATMKAHAPSWVGKESRAEQSAEHRA